MIRDTILVPYPDTVWAVAPSARFDFGRLAIIATAAFTAFAAFASFRAVAATRTASQAALLSGLLSEYARPKMKNALRVLGWHRATYGDEFVAKQRDHLNRNWPSGVRVDEARRYLSHYFFRVHRLRAGGYISEKLFNQISELDGVALLLTVCEPLASDLHPEYRKDFFEAYRARWGDRKDEHRIRPLPQSAPLGGRVWAAKHFIRRLEHLEPLTRGLHSQVGTKAYRFSHAGVFQRIDEIEALARLDQFETAFDRLQDKQLEQDLRAALDVGMTLRRLRDGIGPADRQPPPGQEFPYSGEVGAGLAGLEAALHRMRAVTVRLRAFVGGTK